MERIVGSGGMLIVGDDQVAVAGRRNDKHSSQNTRKYSSTLIGMFSRALSVRYWKER